MKLDPIMNTPDPLHHELERLRRLLRPNPAEFEERRALVERHVSDLSEKLRPAVYRALEREKDRSNSVGLNPQEEAPTEDAINAHTIELAQLLLSNWFGTLEHALQDHHIDRLPLDANALPPQSRHEILLAGCEAFVVPKSEVALILQQYQNRLANRVGVTSLSPTLHLVRTRDSWEVSRSRDELLADHGLRLSIARTSFP